MWARHLERELVQVYDWPSAVSLRARISSLLHTLAERRPRLLWVSHLGNVLPDPAHRFLDLDVAILQLVVELVERLTLWHARCYTAET